MAQSAKWDDLTTRIGSAVLMAAVAVIGIWVGGAVWHGLIALICGAMVWELVAMIAPAQPKLAQRLGILSGLSLLVASYAPAVVAVPLLLIPALSGAPKLTAQRKRFMLYATAVLFAGLAMIGLRDDFGTTWMVWLVLVVVVTDVAGYFAGRAFGGPKFWPAISPKKTWSGTLAGWIGAALVGALYMNLTSAGAEVVVISVLMSMAAQAGDIAESAMKRKAGVKDSSALIPGHGGLLDRFDGMLGAALLLLGVELLMAFPPATA